MTTNTKTQLAKPVQGAAEYVAEKDNDQWYVVMYPSDHIGGSNIERCSSEEVAIRKAQRWQKKENRAVLKSQNQI